MCFIYLGLLLLGVCSALYPCVVIVLFLVFWLCRLKNIIYDLINKMLTAFASHFIKSVFFFFFHVEWLVKQDVVAPLVMPF